MTRNTAQFCREVAQMVEFAGFGPCAAVGSVVMVQAFATIKRYAVLPSLDIPIKGSAWRFPNALSPRTLAVCRIIEDAFVSQGMPEPGQNSIIRIASPELPFRIEIRYLWLADPVAMQKVVLAMLFEHEVPAWATESLMDYHAKRDTNLAQRVHALLETYSSDHPQPSPDIIEVIPEILDTVDHL